MDKQKQMEIAKQFFEGVEMMESALEVMDGTKHKTKFYTGGDGVWTVVFSPEGQAANT